METKKEKEMKREMKMKMKIKRQSKSKRENTGVHVIDLATPRLLSRVPA